MQQQFFRCIFVVSMFFMLFACSGKPKPATASEEDPAAVTDPSSMTIEQLDMAIAAEPLNPDLFYYKGIYDANSGDYTAAIDHFSQAIELDTTFASAYHDRGICRFELEDYEGAILDYTRAIALESQVPEYFYNRGWAYSMVNKTELALKDYNSSIALNPEFAEAYFRRGYTVMAQNKDAGCADIKKAASLGYAKAQTEYEKICP